MVSIAFKLQAFPEKRQELMQTLEAIKEKTSGMRDCVSFVMQQDPENWNAITMMMEWRSPEAFRNYQQSEQFGVLMGAFNVLCASKKIHYDLVDKCPTISQLSHTRRPGQ
jgi:quinol monooxygenase YgiN